MKSCIIPYSQSHTTALTCPLTLIDLVLDRVLFFFSSRRRHTRCSRDWSSDVCSSDLPQQTFHGMLPPEQSLRAHDAVAAQIDDGLEKQAELVALEGDMQVGLETDQAYGGAAHAWRVCNGELTLLPLGDRPGHVRLTPRVLGALQPRGDAGKSHSRGDLDAVLAQRERLLARVLKLGGDGVCGRGRLHLVHEHGQLLAPPTGQHAFHAL